MCNTAQAGLPLLLMWVIIMRHINYLGYEVFENGDIYSIHSCKKLRPEITKWGYYRITIFKNKIRYRMSLSRLIATLFILNPKNKPQINHKNGIKSHNWVDNLEWCTPSENMLHAFKNRLQVQPKGINHKQHH